MISHWTRPEYHEASTRPQSERVCLIGKANLVMISASAAPLREPRPNKRSASRPVPPPQPPFLLTAKEISAVSHCPSCPQMYLKLQNTAGGTDALHFEYLLCEINGRFITLSRFSIWKSKQFNNDNVYVECGVGLTQLSHTAGRRTIMTDFRGWCCPLVVKARPKQTLVLAPMNTVLMLRRVCSKNVSRH